MGNIAKFLEDGVVVRLYDKVERLTTLLRKKENPNWETVDDTWMDAGVYGFIGLICRRGEWKE